MKTIIKLSLGLFLTLFMMGCTKNFDTINENPNQPAEVITPTLLTAAQKGFCDDIYDEWWGGRQSMLWAEYWVQRNYPSEDRYAIRQNINNQYWRLLYHDVMNLQEIIKLNTDADTKAKAAVYGDNNNQIAVAIILKVWACQQMADTWGDIPYSEAFKGDVDPSVSIPTPKYDKLQNIYASFQTELKTAVDMINVDASGFTSGDVIFGGNMEKWKKFGNSLRLRVAMRLSNTDNYAAAKAIAGEEGIVFMESNADNASFSYIGAAPNNSPLYDAWWTSARNDFTVAKPLVDLLKGQDDTLNLATKPAAINPFHGLIDPRLQMYTRDRPAGSGKYYGIPYGMTESQTQAYWGKRMAPSYYGNAAYSSVTAPVILNSKYAPVFMEYAEVEFMLSEMNNWDQSHYVAGVTASIDHWRDICATLEGWDAGRVTDLNTQRDAYIAALPPASKVTVMAQKYIAFFNQAYQAWAEYRRTGEPGFLIKPNEQTSGTIASPIPFIPLVEMNNLPWRLTYPQQEFTVNGSSVTAAAAAIGGDQMTTKLYWEKAK